MVIFLMKGTLKIISVMTPVHPNQRIFYLTDDGKHRYCKGNYWPMSLQRQRLCFKQKGWLRSCIHLNLPGSSSKALPSTASVSFFQHEVLCSLSYFCKSPQQGTSAFVCSTASEDHSTYYGCGCLGACQLCQKIF